MLSITTSLRFRRSRVRAKGCRAIMAHVGAKHLHQQTRTVDCTIPGKLPNRMRNNRRMHLATCDPESLDLLRLLTSSSSISGQSLEHVEPTRPGTRNPQATRTLDSFKGHVGSLCLCCRAMLVRHAGWGSRRSLQISRTRLTRMHRMRILYIYTCPCKHVYVHVR